MENHHRAVVLISARPVADPAGRDLTVVFSPKTQVVAEQEKEASPLGRQRNDPHGFPPISKI